MAQRGGTPNLHVVKGELYWSDVTNTAESNHVIQGDVNIPLHFLKPWEKSQTFLSTLNILFIVSHKAQTIHILGI